MIKSSYCIVHGHSLSHYWECAGDSVRRFVLTVRSWKVIFIFIEQGHCLICCHCWTHLLHIDHPFHMICHIRRWTVTCHEKSCIISDSAEQIIWPEPDSLSSNKLQNLTCFPLTIILPYSVYHTKRGLSESEDNLSYTSCTSLIPDSLYDSRADVVLYRRAERSPNSDCSLG